MLVEDGTGRKVACQSCINGHRSTKCDHTDRMLIEVKTPGRPLSECPHVKKEECKCKSGTEARPRKATIVVTAAIPKKDAKRPCARNQLSTVSKPPTPAASPQIFARKDSHNDLEIVDECDEDDAIKPAKKKSCCASNSSSMRPLPKPIAPRPTQSVDHNTSASTKQLPNETSDMSYIPSLQRTTADFDFQSPIQASFPNHPPSVAPSFTSPQLTPNIGQTFSHQNGQWSIQDSSWITNSDATNRAFVPSHQNRTADHPPPMTSTFFGNVSHTLMTSMSDFTPNEANNESSQYPFSVSSQHNGTSITDLTQLYDGSMPYNRQSLPFQGGMSMANGTRDHPFTQYSQPLQAFRNRCNCGTTCNCTGCPEHMYNSTMKNKVRDAYEAVHLEKHHDVHRSSNIMRFPEDNPVQAQPPNDDDLLYFQYEIDVELCTACFRVPSQEPTGKCLCGDSCSCVACDTHRKVSTPKLQNNSWISQDQDRQISYDTEITSKLNTAVTGPEQTASSDSFDLEEQTTLYNNYLPSMFPSSGECPRAQPIVDIDFSDTFDFGPLLVTDACSETHAS